MGEWGWGMGVWGWGVEGGMGNGEWGNGEWGVEGGKERERERERGVRRERLLGFCWVMGGGGGLLVWPKKIVSGRGCKV